MFGSTASSEKKPRVYLFFGNDELAMHKLVQGLVDKVMDVAMGDMNITRFQENPRVDEVRDAAYMIPMFGDRRLVLLTNAQDWVKGSKNKDSILKLLDGLPGSTALVLQLNLELERGNWKDFAPAHWLRKWVKDQPAGTVFQKECSLPGIGQMPGLIMKEAKEKKGEFSPEAAQELTRAIGNDTLIASLEIDKLLTYVDYQRPVTAEDVRLLTPEVAPISVFDMVDAIGERNIPKAAQLLHRLLETEMPIPLFGMIVRQFRLLILAREVIDQGGRKSQIEKALKVHPFVAEKLQKQASLFDMNQLKEIYHRLLTTDEYMKTGQMDPKIAMEMFVSEMSTV
ncbi:MAG: DNA polymerase III subunit delta [Chloroflexi bacterium HGW-Chloroflexi-2]|jgi:DNA polymerase-3 subunit delta|nr:MAG: DNA polymerase III subunit delta [Chloroflexi bacterium HGW-Chloroflexi-2]